MKNNRKYSKQVVFQTKNNRNIQKHFQTGKITEHIQTCFQFVEQMGRASALRRLSPHAAKPAAAAAPAAAELYMTIHVQNHYRNRQNYF